MELTAEEIEYGFKIVICNNGHEHKVQTVSPIIEPYNCSGLCLKEKGEIC
jgi:hypothetical protein